MYAGIVIITLTIVYRYTIYSYYYYYFNLITILFHLYFQTVIDYVRSNRDKTLQEIINHFNLQISIVRLSQILCKAGLHSFAVRKRQGLSVRQQVTRRTFASRNLRRNWYRIIFSDEKTMQSTYNGRRRERRVKGEEETAENQQSVPSTSRFKVCSTKCAFKCLKLSVYILLFCFC